MKVDKEADFRAGSLSVAKLFLSIFLPVMVLVGSIAFVLFYRDQKFERANFENREAQYIKHQVERTGRLFKSIISDLMFLSSLNETQEFLEGTNPNALKKLAKEYLIFAEVKGMYDQIRFLNEKGMEVARINFEKGKPYIVPEGQLQSKTHQYYFKDTFKLGSGEVYASPFDLNIERGQIEQPLKPVIRIGTPVFNSSGSRKGIVILNYLGAFLIKNLERVTGNAPAMVTLINSDGFWLKGPRREDEWGFMFQERKNRTFGNAYPDAWQQISGTESGHFYNKDGLFTFATVYPLLPAWKSINYQGKAFGQSSAQFEDKGYYWKIVSHVSPDFLNPESRKLLSRLLQLYAVFGLLLAFGSWILANTRVSRKLKEEALKESNLRFCSLVNSCQEGIIVYEKSMRCTLWNPAMEHIFGIKEEQLLGKTPFEVFPFLDKVSEGDSFREAVKGKATVQLAVPYDVPETNKKGYFESSHFPLFDAKGNTIGGMGIIRDITREVKAKKELERLNNNLKSNNEELQQIVMVTSHDLRSPMVNIVGFAREIEKTLKDIRSILNYEDMTSSVKKKITPLLEDDIKNSIENIRACSSKMDGLISGLLMVSRLGRVPIKIIPLDMNKLIASIGKTFRYKFKSLGIAITINELPSCRGDIVQINQVFCNLLDNAIKYLSSERPGIIKISGRKEAEQAVYCLEDNGIGIPKESQKNVFDIFFRLKPKTNTGEGLGLAIINKILVRHGGKVWVESELDKGSRFYISLPV